MSSLLFFDDSCLHQRANLSRHIGCPSLVPDGTLKDPYVDPAWGYPTVFRDPVTRHYQRTSREPFMPNAAPGQYGAGCIYPSSVVPDGDVLRIYSSAAIGEHAQIRGGPASRQGAILLHTLRRDGFVYLEPDAGTGELVTRLLLWAGGEPELNVQAPSGELRLQITSADGVPLEGYAFEDCWPFQGDAIGWVPEWRDGRKTAALAGRIIRIHVRVTNGRLFALRGNFAVKTAHEAGQYLPGGAQ